MQIKKKTIEQISVSQEPFVYDHYHCICCAIMVYEAEKYAEKISVIAKHNLYTSLLRPSEKLTREKEKDVYTKLP